MAKAHKWSLAGMLQRNVTCMSCLCQGSILRQLKKPLDARYPQAL
jgi:hypothetical protein